MSQTFLVPVIVAGAGSPASLSGVRFNSYDSQNSWVQNNIQNLSNGSTASSDWIATADTGNDSTNYVDFGINGSGYSSASWTVNGALDGYLYSASSGLAVGTATTGKQLIFFTGGTLAANIRMIVADNAVTFKAPVIVEAGLGVQILEGAPGTTTDTLYQLNGVLCWDGVGLGNHIHSLLTPSFSANIMVSPNANTGHVRITLGGATTINMNTTGYDTQKITLELVQDSSGNRSASLGSGFSWGSDITSYSSPTLTANKADIIGLIYNAATSSWRVIAIARGY